MSGWVHLARRFTGSLRPGGPAAPDEAWAVSRLNLGEALLWRQMSGPDRRHAIEVARDAVARLGSPQGPDIVAAALLHDVGKIDAGLGTFGRVGATLVGRVRGPDGVAPTSRVGRYLHHAERGAALLTVAGSAPLTVAWAREHHQPATAWTVPLAVAEALKAADDD